MGPSAKDTVSEHDGVRLGPGNLFAKSWSYFGLIRSTGPGWLTTEGYVAIHQRLCCRRCCGLALEQFRMEQIQAGDIEGCRHEYLGTAIDQPLDEVDTRLSVIETRVDVCPGNRQQPVCVHGLREPHNQPHGHSGARTVVAVEHCLLV